MSGHHCDMPDLPDNDARDGLIAAAEDLADVQAAREAREEIAAGTPPPIPWEDVKVTLGLT